MTPDQIKLIQQSWAQVVPIADAVPQIFYDRLFEIDPTTKPLFAKTDMPRQHGKLLDALELVTDNAERLGDLLPALEDLGRRHVRYGVADEHYNSVGAALLWTLEQGLGEDFTDDVREAWTNVYGMIAGAMRQEPVTH